MRKYYGLGLDHSQGPEGGALSGHQERPWFTWSSGTAQGPACEIHRTSELGRVGAGSLCSPLTHLFSSLRLESQRVLLSHPAERRRMGVSDGNVNKGSSRPKMEGHVASHSLGPLHSLTLPLLQGEGGRARISNVVPHDRVR